MESLRSHRTVRSFVNIAKVLKYFNGYLRAPLELICWTWNSVGGGTGLSG